jgi:LmbE family N-acetylglucosaminyl deacetylase
MHEPTFIVDISDCFEAKMEAIKCYKSQFHDPKSNEPITYIATEGFLNNIKYRDSVTAKKIGTEYAEGFSSENIPGISDLDSLLLPEIP